MKRSGAKLDSKHVVVTGGAGFIGKKLVDQLKTLGYKVSIFDRVNNRDVTNWKDFESLSSKKIDAIIHLAGKIFVPESWEKPREFYEINTFGTLNVLEFCREKKIAKLVFISSYVYGEPQYLPIDENHPLSALNPYMKSKLLAEELCCAYHENYGISCVILRPFNVYGEGQPNNFLVPKIISQALTGKEIVLDDPKPKRDILYIDDLIEALIKAVDYNASKYEVFNIGSGKSYKIGEIIDAVSRALKIPIKVSYLDRSRKNEIPETLADISKGRNILKWNPYVSMEEGLNRMIKSIKGNMING